MDVEIVRPTKSSWSLTESCRLECMFCWDPSHKNRETSGRLERSDKRLSIIRAMSNYVTETFPLLPLTFSTPDGTRKSGRNRKHDGSTDNRLRRQTASRRQTVSSYVISYHGCDWWVKGLITKQILAQLTTDRTTHTVSRLGRRHYTRHLPHPGEQPLVVVLQSLVTGVEERLLMSYPLRLSFSLLPRQRILLKWWI